MNAIITVLARSGSKGIPNKALTPIHGRTLIEWSLLHATQFGHYPIVVSSDSRDILSHARTSFPDITTYHRPRALATDDCPKMTAIAHVAKKYSQVAGVTLDAVIDLDVCNPMRHWQDIASALGLYQSHHNPNSVVSVTPARRSPYFNMVVGGNDGYGDVDLVLVNRDRDVSRRQDAPQVWDLNSCIYIYNPGYLATHTHPVGTRTYCYPMPPHTFCDIDHPLDLTIVTHLMKEYGYA